MRQAERDRQRMTALLVGIDLSELQVEILALFERKGIRPEDRRRIVQGSDFGGWLDVLGGPREVLRQAIATIRAPHGLADGP